MPRSNKADQPGSPTSNVASQGSVIKSTSDQPRGSPNRHGAAHGKESSVWSATAIQGEGHSYTLGQYLDQSSNDSPWQPKRADKSEVVRKQELLARAEESLTSIKQPAPSKATETPTKMA